LVRGWIPFRGVRFDQADREWHATHLPAGLGELRRSRGSSRLGGSRVYRGASRCSTQANLWNRRETQTGVAAHWLAAILRGLRRRPCGRRTLPSRISSLAAVISIEVTYQTLMTFAPSFPTRLDLAIRLLAEPDCLSWGFPKMPLRRLSSGSPLPGTVHEHARSGFPFGRRAPTPLRVPSSWFLTISTGSSSLRQPHCPCGP